MNTSGKSLLLCLPFALAFVFFGCQSGTNNTNESNLGEIDFKVIGKDAVQPYFKKGLLLLHSFEYADAAESFQQARELDPGFVMAYWGEAMTCNHPLWQAQDFDKGNAILAALAKDPVARVEKAGTQIEKDFMVGVNILYGEGNKAERDSTYAAWMKNMYQKYPGDDEVAAFYSLALNGWGITERDINIFKLAAAIGNEVLERNPQHPGALHYVIHADDNPDYAKQALATADKYAKVAPDAGHALHMPTHTYLALGMWDKVVSSNEVSWAAEQNRMKRKKLDNDALGYHAYHWLQYGYLQQGNKPRAKLMLDSMRIFCQAKPSPRARAHLTFLKTTYLGETDDYASDASAIPVDTKGLNIAARASNYFVQGMYAYHRGERDALHQSITKLAGERLTEQERAADKGIRLCGNISGAIATKTDLVDAEVMEWELKAMQSWLEKDAVATELCFRKAIELQLQNGYAYGPPIVVKPSFEMYGEWLLENGRPQEALSQFEQGLKLMPNKAHLVQGKAEAAARLKEVAMVAH